MFKPEGTDSIWVPLAGALWGWKGIAESSDEGETWSKTYEYEFPPAAGSTTEFPEWDDTKTNEPVHPDWQPD